MMVSVQILCETFFLAESDDIHNFLRRMLLQGIAFLILGESGIFMQTCLVKQTSAAHF